MSAFMALALSSLLSVFGKLFTQVFFEKILTKLVIYCLEKLAPMTTNQLDDEIVKDIKFLLTNGEAKNERENESKNS